MIYRHIHFGGVVKGFGIKPAFSMFYTRVQQLKNIFCIDSVLNAISFDLNEF